MNRYDIIQMLIFYGPPVGYVVYGLLSRLVFKMPIFLGLFVYSISLVGVGMFLGVFPYFGVAGEDGLIELYFIAWSIIGLVVATPIGAIELFINYLSQKKKEE